MGYGTAKDYTVEKYEAATAKVAETYETTTTYVNETVVEPVVEISKKSFEYTKCKTEEVKTFSYDTTMTAYENLKALFDKYTLALGSRKEAPTVDDVPVASV